MNNIEKSVKEALKLKSGDPNGSTYQSLRKLHTQFLIDSGEYFVAAYNLVEAIAPSTRSMARFRYERKLCENDKEKSLKACSKMLNKLVENTQIDISNDPFMSYLSTEHAKYAKKVNAHNEINYNDIQKDFLHIDHVKHLDCEENSILRMKTMLKELPNEWTVVQITANPELNEHLQPLKSVKTKVDFIYLTVLSNDKLKSENIEPFTIRIVPEPLKSVESEKPLFQELYSTIEENLHVIENNSRVTNNSIAIYWEKRNECDLRMKSVISIMDTKWLGGWRCLLSGQIKSDALKQTLNTYIDEICDKNKIHLSSLQRFLLYSLISECNHVSLTEASSFIRSVYIEYSPDTKTNSNGYCQLCTSNKTFNNLCIKCNVKNIINTTEYKSFRKCFLDAVERIRLGTDLVELKLTPRDPLILLIDEKLDMFPWEMLPILVNKPVTRIECLNFAYGLFKKHEKNIIKGYFQLQPNIGNYIINPGGDLKKMEKRMSSFIHYWCPKWKGETNVKQSSDLYEKYLQESNIFLYCGHGDGSHYIGGGTERLAGIKSVAVLSGCGSVALRYPGPGFLPVPVHSHFHIANCPSVIGMLWEVTDLEVDKVTSTLLGLFVPSDTQVHWGNVDKSQWTRGIIDGSKTNEKKKIEMEPDLLKALARSRRSTDFVMIAASIVSRGLPVLLKS